MKVISQGRVFYNGQLYVKGEELDVAPQEKTAKEFIRNRVFVAKTPTAAAEVEETSAPSRPTTGRYSRRDVRATESES